MPSGCSEDVGRLDVAVDDADRVRGAGARGPPASTIVQSALLEVQRARPPPRASCEVLPLDELHGEEVPAVLLAHEVDVGQVRDG